MGSLIAESPSLVIYAAPGTEDCTPRDECTPGDTGGWESESLDEFAQKICKLLDEAVLEQIEHWVGPVADLDGNGKLTIVISQLEFRHGLSEPPVLGCVRESDFLGHSMTPEGVEDVVYLDLTARTSSDLTSLLIHEVTHAAVYSRFIASDLGDGARPRNQRVPAPWLNESIAHVMELRLAGCPATLSLREQAFRGDPSQSPIVASPDHLSLSARRLGSRAAGTLFLNALVRTPQDLSLALSLRGPEEIARDLTGRPFAEVFRDWTLSHLPDSCAIRLEQVQSPVTGSSATRPADANDVRYSLYGTAFLRTEFTHGAADVIIEADDGAQLQVTILQ